MVTKVWGKCLTRNEGFNVITRRKGYSRKGIFEQRPEGCKIGGCAKIEVKSIFKWRQEQVQRFHAGKCACCFLGALGRPIAWCGDGGEQW